MKASILQIPIYLWFFVTSLVCGSAARCQEESTPRIDWIAHTNPDKHSSFGGFTLDGDQIFVGAEDGEVRAFHKKTGELLWTVERQGRAFCAPPCDESRVYFATHLGLTAVKRSDGEFDWRFAIPSGAEYCVLVPHKKLVVVGGCNGFIYGVSAETGIEAWELNILEDAPPAPEGVDLSGIRGELNSALPMGMQYDKASVYVCIADQCRVVAIDLATGKKKWSYQAADGVYYGPTISEKDLILGSEDTYFHCLHKDTGEIKWKFKTDGRTDVPGIIEKEMFFVGAGDGRFYCINMSDGSEKWRFEIEKDEAEKEKKGGVFGISSLPVLSKEQITFTSQDSTIYLLEKASGKLKSKFRIDAHSAVWKDNISDGERLYVVLRRRYLRPENIFDPLGHNAIVAVKLKQLFGE